MAAALEDAWPNSAPQPTGVVVTRDGHGQPCRWIEVLEASHPTPDRRSVDAAERVLEAVQGLGEDDLVICLLSGGGSSLLCGLPTKISLEDYQRVNTQLLACGAPIGAINCVRRHLSNISGGRLARFAWPARVETLAISDVPGDEASAIASGPTVGDPSTRVEALRILHEYAIALPLSVRQWLQSEECEPVRPDSAFLAHSSLQIIASPKTALDAAAQFALDAGVSAQILSAEIQDESRLAAKHHAEALGALRGSLLLSGGETTVKVRGRGNGGRNVEFLLALALELKGRPGVTALAADTDGIDGNRAIAGAWIDPSTLDRARVQGLDARDFLDRNDAHTFFELLGDSLVTGPTGTNLNDFRAIYVASQTL